jgi:hypothetical protein
VAFTPFAARNAKVRLNNVVYVAKLWTVRPYSDKADTSNAEGLGYGQGIGTLLEADISIDNADVDGDSNPWDPAGTLQIMPGQNAVGALNLYLNATGGAGVVGGPFWNFPTPLCLEAPNTSDVRKASSFSSKWYGNGSFTFPEGDPGASGAFGS